MDTMASLPVRLVIALLLLSNCLVSTGDTCRQVRFATYNTSLNRNKAGQLLAELRSGVSQQAANVSAILQTIRPDVLVLNEFDYEPNNTAVEAFQDKFLGVPQAPGLKPLRYPYVYTAPVNTGMPSGRDFDHDGKTDGPADAFGYGFHPGQYGMVLLSHFPIDAAASRTFQHFLARDMPGALLPKDPETGLPWYSQDDLKVLRLSSKSLWDVPVDIPLSRGDSTGASSKRVHMLLHHPTPPAFDGPEGRNLLRNHDEIRMAADYVGCTSYPAPSKAAGGNITSESSRGSSRGTNGGNKGSSGSSGSSNGGRCGSLGHGVVGKVCKAGSMGWTWLRAQLGIKRRQQQQQQQQHQGPAEYLYDDEGKCGGLPTGSSFVIAGDHNADPLDGNSYDRAIMQLLDCCGITAGFTPVSEGGKEAGNRRPTDRTPPETKTATFGLRVDYVLPSKDLKVLGGAVFWPPRAQQPQAGWIKASDHRPVYLDVEVCAKISSSS